MIWRRNPDYERVDLRLIIPKTTSPAPSRPREAGSRVAVFDVCVLIVNVSAPSLIMFPLVWTAVMASDPPLNNAKFAAVKLKE